ncbi:MAG TPA: hypothetical protein VD866_07295 [Urbifossiella sp.]|nr:hypothetical protein [Urbifossiella sp.]
MPSPLPPRATLSFDRLEQRDVPSAATLDLSTRGTGGDINGARFEQHDARPTGTGHIQSFVRVQALGNRTVEAGVNTDARPLTFDENKSPQFTRSMRVADLPLVNVGGTFYREVLLDINQKASASQLSLDELKVFVGGAGNLNYNATTGTLGGADPVYDLDAGGDNRVRLDARLNTGSGSGDMRFYVPNDILGGGEYFYLYSKFGQTIAANGGFEEWAAGSGGSSVAPQASGFSGILYGLELDGQPAPAFGGTLQLILNGIVVDEVTVGTDGTFAFNNVLLDQPEVTFQLAYLQPPGSGQQLWLDPERESTTVTLYAGDTTLLKDLYLTSVDPTTP